MQFIFVTLCLVFWMKVDHLWDKIVCMRVCLRRVQKRTKLWLWLNQTEGSSPGAVKPKTSTLRVAAGPRIHLFAGHQARRIGPWGLRPVLFNGWQLRVLKGGGKFPESGIYRENCKSVHGDYSWFGLKSWDTLKLRGKGALWVIGGMKDSLICYCLRKQTLSKNVESRERNAKVWLLVMTFSGSSGRNVDKAWQWEFSPQRPRAWGLCARGCVWWRSRFPPADQAAHLLLRAGRVLEFPLKKLTTFLYFLACGCPTGFQEGSLLCCKIQAVIVACRFRILPHKIFFPQPRHISILCNWLSLRRAAHYELYPFFIFPLKFRSLIDR